MGLLNTFNFKIIEELTISRSLFTLVMYSIESFKRLVDFMFSPEDPGKLSLKEILLF